MNLIAFLFWVTVAMFVGGCCLCLHIGYRFGLEDREPRYAPYRQMADLFEPEPGPAVPDDEWDRIVDGITAEGRERMLRDTGELAKLYGRPYPGDEGGVLFGPFDTGELRQLAYAGDLAALEADTAAFIASLEEGDAA